MNIATQISQCRVCGKSEFGNILDLGEQKIANGFHDKSEEQIGAPLNLIRCISCGLVQLAHSVNTDLMYKKYWYRSGVNQTMRDYLKGAADKIMSLVEILPNDVVIDIGSNDGTFLSYYPNHAVKIGVDPSNIMPTNCIHINDYFNFENVKEVLNGRKAKVVTSIAMFYDLSDPKSFVRDVRKVLADDGIWVLEMSYLPRMIANNAYDSICHEHVTYYSMSTFLPVLEGLGLNVIDSSFTDINGGSFRMVVSPSAPSEESVKIIDDIIETERSLGLGHPEVYQEFSNRVLKHRDDLLSFLSSNSDKKIYGYGASTKGQIIMQFCGIDSRHIAAIAERNPDKYGLYTPGSDVRICSEEEMRKANPDYLLVFPWYFFDEFQKRETNTHQAGCKFILPLPELSIR